jgi:hypothetical protein
VSCFDAQQMARWAGTISYGVLCGIHARVKRVYVARVIRKATYAIIAALTAALMSIVTLTLVGVMLPIWTMIALYGRQQVQEAPGHGGVILFATVPIVGLLCPILFAFVVERVYQLLSKT